MAKNIPVGAQLYIFSKSQPDWAVTLRALKAAGYGAVENFADNREIPRLCRENELTFAAVHTNSAALRDSDSLLEFCDFSGARDVCVSGLLEWNARSLSDYRATINFLNQRGAELRERGIFVHYHNHDFEFETDEHGVRGIDLLLEGLNFEALDFCFDAGWAALAGDNAALWMQTHAAKIGFLHLRDFKGRQACALGQGDLDLAAPIAVLPSLTNLRGLMVEQDPTTDNPLRDMVESRAYLKSQFGI